jgi:hypothetical protein
MTECQANRDDLKRKIRKFKKLEVKIRFGHPDAAHERNGATSGDRPKVPHARADQANVPHAPVGRPNAPLVWDEFFDLHESGCKHVKYPMNLLATMDKEAFREVVSEFFYYVYHRMYEENGLAFIHAYDPDMLAQMGLRYDADINAVKKKFRELAMKHHPDKGGESARFIELMETYRKLVDG